jgi:hypothetical protein
VVGNDRALLPPLLAANRQSARAKMTTVRRGPEGTE